MHTSLTKDYHMTILWTHKQLSHINKYTSHTNIHVIKYIFTSCKYTICMQTHSSLTYTNTYHINTSYPHKYIEITSINNIHITHKTTYLTHMLSPETSPGKFEIWKLLRYSASLAASQADMDMWAYDIWDQFILNKTSVSMLFNNYPKKL